MALVTSDQVRVLLRENATDMPDDQVTQHIDTADLIVSEDLAGSGLSNARLTQIELYLAAHFAVLAWEKGGLDSQSIGDSSENYKRISTRNTGFTSTRFGQQALALDTSNTLRLIEDKATSSLKSAYFRVV